MSVGDTVAIHAVPFFDLLDREVESVAETVFGAGRGEGAAANVFGEDADAGTEPEVDMAKVSAAMEASRRRLAQGVEAFIRRLPAAVRTDTVSARSAAYALVGLADERMLHYPSGELPGWRDQLLESELYGSALAGQEIVRQARSAAQGAGRESNEVLAPLYLALFREGFEGSLRGDVLGLTSLTSTLEESVGAARRGAWDVASESGPRRVGVPAAWLAFGGIALWLLSGLALWWALAGGALRDAERLAQRIDAGLSATFDPADAPSIVPAALPPVEPAGAFPADEFDNR